MKCVYTAVITLYFFILFEISKGEVSDAVGFSKKEECYRAEFSEDVWPCPDFENMVLICAPLELGAVAGEDGGLGLSGLVNTTEDIQDGTMMNVEIWKVTDIGNEYLYHAQGDICASLDDRNTPWFPMFDAMKINKCPIAMKSYNIKDMVINLDHAKEMLTHELCGEYLVQLSMTKDLDKLSCHELGVAVSEYSCESTDE